VQTKDKILPGKLLLLLAVILILGGLLFSGCTMRSTPVGWSGVAVTDDALFVASLEGELVGLNKSDGNPLWPACPLGTSKAKVAVYTTPAADGDLVYVGGYNGKVFTVSSASGYRGWVYPPDGNLEPIVSGLVVSGGRVYFGCNDGKVYALSADEPRKEWEFQTDDKVWSTPVVSGETVYVSSFDKKVYALNAADGTKKWHFETGGGIVSTPLVYNDTVYIGSFDRHIYAVDADNGSLRWRSEVEADKWFWAQPVAYDNVIYAPNLDGKVYMLDAENGYEVASPIELDSPISSSPVVVGDKVIIASQEGRVFSLDTSSNRVGTSIFRVSDDEEIRAPLCTSEGVVYIHAQTSKHDTLYAVDAETGREVWVPVSLS
jgi:outer membrane protein assembly factor BamB